MNSMPVAKNRFWSYSTLLLGIGDEMESLKVLDANLGHVQHGVAGIKDYQYRAHGKLDGMSGRLDMLRDKLDLCTSHVNRHIDDVSKRIDRASEKVSAVHTNLTAQLDTVSKDVTAEVREVSAAVSAVRKDMTVEVSVLRTDLSQKIDVMRGELFAVKSSIAAAKVWTLTLQLTIAASLLGVIAHGFKWL